MKLIYKSFIYLCLGIIISCGLFNKVTTSKETSNVEAISKKIGKNKAIEDVREFKKILEQKSSYAQITDFNYVQSLENIENKIKKGSKNIAISWLCRELKKIMAEIPDRHASVKLGSTRNFKECNFKALKPPFTLKRLGKNIVALSPKKSSKQYQYFNKDYPYVKNVEGMSINEFFDKYLFRSKKAPLYAHLSQCAKDFRYITEPMYLLNKDCKKELKITLTNFEKDLTINVKLGDNARGAHFVERKLDAIKDEIREKNYKNAIQWLSGKNIGYIAIPKMFGFKKEFEKAIVESFITFQNAKALIVDLRYNGGGTRNILQTMAPFLIPPKSSPWVGNVAYLRTNNPTALTESEIESMNGRFLFRQHSENFKSETIQKALNNFMRSFQIKKSFDKAKFSKPFYMVVESNGTFYKRPVYILVNERCFSAATVFTTFFKGLPNVKIVGVTPDGSSGRSIKMYLKNSNIRVKVSTMVSLQRNGKTLDGNGIEPDIFIDEKAPQILGQKDTQLEKLIAHIDKNNSSL